MDLLVSIIVPCYNQGHFLSEALNSVLNQTYSNWECIIVNDGSTDNTDKIADSWVLRDDRFKYIFKENGGLSSARNEGIKNAIGEFILPLDSDDIIDKAYLTILVPVLLTDKSLAIVSCYSKFFNKKISNVTYELKPIGSTIRDLIFENNLIATSLFRKECWKEVGGYDENMKKGFEDWEFWISITKRGWNYKIIKDFLFYYRKAKKSMLVDTLKNHRVTNMEYIYKKHKDIYIENYDNTIKYLFFLIKLYRQSEMKTKNSLEYKLAKIIVKPFRIFKKLNRKQ
jgi:glycosyltransferase involved in cell wall biosynthesis